MMIILILEMRKKKKNLSQCFQNPESSQQSYKFSIINLTFR